MNGADEDKGRAYFNDDDSPRFCGSEFGRSTVFTKSANRLTANG
jgi:hypothetical protein